MFEKTSEECLGKVIEVLNKRKWVPLIRKEKALEMLVGLSISWRADAEKALQLKEECLEDEKRMMLEQLNNERKEDMGALRDVFGEYRNMVLECSKVAFCHVECGTMKYSKCDGICRRRDEYARTLLEGLKDFMSEDFGTLLNDKQREIWEKLMQGK